MVPAEYKTDLISDMNGKLKDWQLYACVKRSDGDLEFHFLKEKAMKQLLGTTGNLITKN